MTPSIEEVVEPLLPRDGELFLEKIRHSAFYATSLAYLLRSLEPNRLILMPISASQRRA